MLAQHRPRHAFHELLADLSFPERFGKAFSGFVPERVDDRPVVVLGEPFVRPFFSHGLRPKSPVRFLPFSESVRLRLFAPRVSMLEPLYYFQFLFANYPPGLVVGQREKVGRFFRVLGVPEELRLGVGDFEFPSVVEKQGYHVRELDDYAFRLLDLHLFGGSVYPCCEPAYGVEGRLFLPAFLSPHVRLRPVEQEFPRLPSDHVVRQVPELSEKHGAVVS